MALHGTRAAAFAGVALAAALLPAMACRSPLGRAEDSTLSLAVRADVTGFYPNRPYTNEGFTLGINANVFEGLVAFDSRLRLAPALAGRWTNPDERTYVFELRPGLRFSDGSPVTAADVAASLEAVRRHRWPNPDYFQAVASVRAVAKDRVEIRTRAPYLVLLMKLPWGFVMPARAVDQSPVPAVGTGPYRLESWTPGREFVLVANPHYWGPPPPFQRVRAVVEMDDAARLRAVLEGRADLADHVPLHALDQLGQQPGFKVLVRQTVRVLFLALRVSTPPFSDPRVREAVDVALDREELIRRALGGRAVAASQVVPPAVVGYDARISLPAVDRERARRLLAEAGYPQGLEVRLDGPFNRYVGDRGILEEVSRQLAEVGIRAHVNALDKAVYFRLVDARHTDFHLLGWSCEALDAGELFDSVLHSPSAEQTVGSSNSIGLADPELDRLIDAANAASSAGERAVRLRAAMARTTQLKVLVPLLIQTEALLLSRRIEWEPPPNMAFQLAQIRPVVAGQTR